MQKQKALRLTASLRKRLPHVMEQYLESCRPPPDASAKKSGTGRLPTMAGFCRFIGCGQGELSRLEREDPTLYDRIRTILEDELLNHSPSPTLLNAYMKRRLGYDGELERGESETACGQMRLIFEHDIEEDGA